MEENTTITEQQTQAEEMGNEAQGTPKEGKGKETKLFTQEEVNGFVQSRISRMRGQIEKEGKAAYEQKLAELEAREMKLLVKEKLSERGMPKELAEIITCTDEEDIATKLDALQKIYGSNAEKKEAPKGFSIGVPNTGIGAQQCDPLRNAMGLNER